ncbi:hypothetical protein SAMN02910447_01864 [Ruminococcus sp. YE71]|uniref:metallophosphoesterase n=1 Tax=unclassified Ruminococcus TaxID=2608920 RepID=UPI00088BD16D|nr:MULTISPECIES: metallophosphoesterase [unclassified Ruminococcus]SDA20840.1 hypothetical protein SAMN02910446_01806 [Ruminococcus sp. YE78]SFW33528.1 hypothetical protein SAMN02910447_01864 [Ruminococcus sp. YE71]
MIYVTGDTHGYYDEMLYRLRDIKIGEGDTLIICGDFGFVWDDVSSRIRLKHLQDEKFTIAFVDGNHENFDLLGQYPVIDWNGGKAHQVGRNIFHMMRGECFTIEGRSFFAFGGAYSVDKPMRTEHFSWWKEEKPSKEDYDNASKTLERIGKKVDYVLTHNIPESTIIRLGKVPDVHDAELTGYFEWLLRELDFKRWYAGHFHVDKDIDKVSVLYDRVLPIE